MSQNIASMASQSPVMTTNQPTKPGSRLLPLLTGQDDRLERPRKEIHQIKASKCWEITACSLILAMLKLVNVNPTTRLDLCRVAALNHEI